MLRRLSPDKRVRARELIRQLDRMAADLNIVLILFALGLAILNVTFLITYSVTDHLPAATRVTFEAPQSPGK